MLCLYFKVLIAGFPRKKNVNEKTIGRFACKSSSGQKTQTCPAGHGVFVRIARNRFPRPLVLTQAHRNYLYNGVRRLRVNVLYLCDKERGRVCVSDE